MKTNKKIIMKAKKLIPMTQSPEELYFLATFTNAYLDKPTKDNKELLEIYCELIESSMELDILEENTKKYVK